MVFTVHKRDRCVDIFNCARDDGVVFLLSYCGCKEGGVYLRRGFSPAVYTLIDCT